MKNQLQQFHSNEFGSFEVLMVDGKPYFPAAESAKVLGYKNPHDAILKHCVKDGLAKREVIDSLNRVQEKNYISEGNLYRLIIRSKLPAAVRFEKWVFDTVLPSIREHGAYMFNDILEEAVKSQDYALELFKKLQDEKGKTAALVEITEELAPKALYCDLILQSENLVPVSLIAKDYGLPAMTFNTLLNALGIQYRMAGTWLPYQKYAGKGYTKTRTHLIDEKISSMHTCWTQKGRLFLYEKLKSCGIVPLAESEREYKVRG